MLRERLLLLCKCVGQCTQLMVGIPDYDNYLAHVTRTHPDQVPMTYEQFFRERQAARYGGSGGGIRCC